MFKPIARGINPSIVVIAVNSTGRNLALPPSIIDSLILSAFNKSLSFIPIEIIFRSINNCV